MQAVAGDQKYWKTCAALFGCGTPFATDAGADELLHGAEPRQGEGADQGGRLQGREDRAADATDQPIVHAQALVTADALKKAGINVEIARRWIGAR